VTDFVLSLPRTPESVGHARSAVRNAVAGRHDDVAELSVLLVNELVANAIVHGVGAISLAMESRPDCLRVVVSDEGDALPVLRDPSPTAEGGRGLSIVNALATRWGVDPADGGKSVWFEIALAR
jgi:anti-sigma regulatory factor (Ser/Thr protein kinase)